MQIKKNEKSKKKKKPLTVEIFIIEYFDIKFKTLLKIMLLQMSSINFFPRQQRICPQILKNTMKAYTPKGVKATLSVR